MNVIYKLILLSILLLITSIKVYSEDRIIMKVDSLIQETDNLWEQDRIEEAIDCINSTIPLILQTYGKQSEAYTDYLNIAARIYQDKGDYKKAFKIIEECLLIKLQIYGKNSIPYAFSLGAKASILSEMGRNIECLNLFEESLKIYKDNNSYYTIENAEIIKDYGIAFYALNDNNQAFKYLNEAYNIVQQLKLTYDDYRVANIGVVYSTILTEIGEMEEAINSLTNVVNELEKCNCNKLVYLYGLSNLASFYKYIGNYPKCIELGNKSLNLIDSTVGDDSSWVNFVIIDIADSYFKLNDYDNAKRYYLIGLNNCEKSLGFEHDMTILYQEKLLDLRLKQNDLKPIEENLYSIYTKKTNKILEDLSLLNSEMQEKYWNEGYFEWYSQKLPFLCNILKKEKINKITYNGLLLSKSLLLDSESRFIHAMKNFSDQSFIVNYENIKKYKQDTSELSKDSLNIEERKLRKDFLSHSNYMDVFTITWENIRSLLNPNELAIEFFCFANEDKNTQYGALTVKYDYTSPHYIPLFTEKELNEIPSHSYYTTQSLKDLIWSPLKDELEHITTVYFSPAGELNNISIENIPLEDNLFLSDIYTIYRVSSTRNIVSQETPLFIVSASLFGDLNYNASINDYKLELNEPKSKNFKFPNNLRAGYSLLPGTKIEIEKAIESLESLNLSINKYTGDNGTKEAFKQMSGNSSSFIHIATHGFFHNISEDSEENMESEKNYGFGNFDSMNHSGLLFSGANNYINHLNNHNDYNNGILTASDVSEMDLFDTDLVVLSACQTGLGEIKGDGVYGLQRGFKMAGCASLMMSLWKVDDDATQLLMSEFYKNYANGLSKQESLQLAQKKVRETPGFSDPEYWAAFILLDALN